jgi:uncharacterized membrane protein YphA (DoxX/SURF4 family)
MDSFQLAGRILLIFLFIGFIFQGSWSFARVIVSIVGLGACIMVAVGFKAKWSASFLVTLLSVFNVFINNWYVSRKFKAEDSGGAFILLTLNEISLNTICELHSS